MKTKKIRKLQTERFLRNNSQYVITSSDTVNKRIVGWSYLPEFLEKNNIETGEILFGFTNSIILYENGFFSFKTKSLHKYQELKRCVIKKDVFPGLVDRLYMNNDNQDVKLDNGHSEILVKECFKDLVEIFGLTDEESICWYEEQQLLRKELEQKREKEKKLKHLLESIRVKQLNDVKNSILSDLDKDGNGVLDIIEGGDFMRLLKKHQPRIKEIDRTYIQRFIQVSNFIKSQSESLQEIFTRINQVENQEELESLVGLLKNNIHTYEQILFHSLNMIVSLVDEDDLTFYEIYETFDKLNVFDSGWEKQVSQKLSDINLNISDLMYSVDRMNVQIVNGLNQLSYITEESNRNLVGQLGEIDSSIRVNNLLTGISTYQLYKINKNTNSLRS